MMFLGLRQNNHLPSGILHTNMPRISARPFPSEAPSGGMMTDAVHGAALTAARVSDAYRWTQLAIGVGAMVMIANYQYGWTFFVPDIQKKFGWDRASIQWAFTLFVLFET